MSDYPVMPSNWTTVQLVDICERITKGSTPTSYGYKYQNEGIRFIKAENIDSDGIVFSATDHIDEETHNFLKRSILQGEDLLFSIAGTIGRVGRVRKSDLPANTNQALAIIRLKPGIIIQKYLFYYLKSDAIQKESLKKIVGVGRANLSLTNIGEFEIHIAPLAQQTRIVAEIEKQFSRLDEAVANLKRVKANLKRYKAAVLKAAVEGKLTEEWRKQHPDVEPADKLLERILAERRKAAGKGKYKEPVGPDTSGLPELPAGWVWASPAQISAGEKYSLAIGPFGSNLKVSDYKTAGVPLVFVRNIRSASFGGDGAIYVTAEKADELTAHQVSSGDLLITKMGDPPGDVCLYPENRHDAVITADCIKLRLSECIQNKLFFLRAIESKVVRNQILGVTKGVAQLKVSLERFSSIGLPLPPIDEQLQIVTEVERRLSIIAEAETQVDANLRRADRLRQSILKQAFSGQLVPQHPDDETASVLLERIRATQPAQTKESVSRQRKHRTPAPKTGGPSPEPLPIVAEAPATYGDAIIARILAVMQPGHEYARADLVEPLGLTTGQWNAAIQELKRVGKVRQMGEKRGARYVLK